ncbi:MAG: DnaJ domain-containing protein [Hyphomicrobium sp.]
MEYKDYYKILGVEKNASQDDIKRAYRKMARTFHPDVNKEAGAEAKFKDAGEAYEVLKDPEKRAAYDQLGANWQQGQDFRPPPNWDQGFEFSGGGYTEADPAQFSDFFEGLFGQAHARGARAGRGGFSSQREFHAQGEDHHAKIAIDLRDAYTGAKREITLRVPEVDGSGHVAVKNRTLSVTIPKGIREGQSIRLAGQGSPGMGKGQAGRPLSRNSLRARSGFPRRRQGHFLRPARDAVGGRARCFRQGPDPRGRRDAEDPAQFHQGPHHASEGQGHSRQSAGRPQRRPQDRAAARRHRQGQGDI